VSLFVDSSMFYAAADAGDRANARAKAVLGGGDRLVTSDHVLVESWFLLRRRLGREVAERWWGSVRDGAATLEPVGPGDLETAWAIAATFADQDFSIVDRTSFAVMQRLGLTRAASLDDDFAVFRYGRRLERAFDVIR
jgi:predicted nucleic acid-binding protein